MPLTFSTALAEQSEDIACLVNSAYRGDSSRLGWTTEADLLGGQRVDSKMILEMISNPEGALLLAQENHPSKTLVGCVYLLKLTSEIAYLGMLTVSPFQQGKGRGGEVLREGESIARSWGCQAIELSVIAQRRELIDWYVRRGYSLTRERKEFPYGNTRFGLPQRQDLFFLILRKPI